MSLLTRAKLRPIGDVSRVQDPIVRNILQSIKEQLDTFRGVTPNGDVLDEIVTKRELVGAGIIDVLAGGRGGIRPGSSVGGVPSLEPLPDLPTPPAPENLTASGGLAVILLTWEGYGYANHAYTEIWRAAVDDLGQAVMIGTAQGQSGMYADTVGGSATYYYWVRFVAVRNGVVRVGPFNSTSGTVGQTGTDPAYLLDVLTGQITSSQLHNDLLAPIELIPDIALSVADIEEELQSINAVLSDIQQIPEFDDSETYNEGDLVRYEGGLYQALTDMLTPPAPLPTNDTYWQKVGDYASLGEAVAAHAVMLADHDSRISLAEDNIIASASDISALETAVYHPTNGLSTKASITQLNAAKSEIYSAEVATFTNIAAQFSSVADDLATKATITQLNTAKSDIYGSAVTAFTQIASEFSTVRGEISTAAKDARDNLILNPSFESGLLPHVNGAGTSGGTWAVADSGSAYHGGKVLQYNSNGQVSAAFMRFNGNLTDRVNHVEAKAGDRFRMSIRHRLTSGAANRVRIRMRARAADGTVLGGSDTTAIATPNSSWALLQQEWEIPSGLTTTAYLQTDLEVLVDGNVGVHQFDLVHLERLDAGAYHRGNLAVNPSFEEGLSPHTVLNAAGGGVWSVEDIGAGNAPHGSKVLRFDSDTQTAWTGIAINGSQTNINLHPAALPGERFRLRVRARLASGAANRFRLYLVSRSNDGTSISQNNPAFTSTSGWQSYTVEHTVAEGASYVQAHIQIESEGESGILEFDSVLFERLDAGAYEAITTTAASVLSEAKTYADEDSAAAQLAQTLQAIVGDEESGLVAAVQTNAQAIADVEGDVYAEYTIKTQLLGGQRVIAGIGLIAEPGGSSIGLMANRIFFAHPSTGADISPFVYDADTETMHVKNASIVNLTATNFVGEEITADKVVSGISITAPTIIGGKVRNTADTNYLDLNASGGSNFLRAGSNFVVTAAGNITFAGTATGGTYVGSRFLTGTSGERIDINPPSAANRILVYDSGGTERIRIGAGDVDSGINTLAKFVGSGTVRPLVARNNSTAMNAALISNTGPALYAVSNSRMCLLLTNSTDMASPPSTQFTHMTLAPVRINPPDNNPNILNSNVRPGSITAVNADTSGFGGSQCDILYLKRGGVGTNTWEKLNNSAFVPGDVGSFAFLYRVGTTVYAPGSLHAAANLRWGNVNGESAGYHSTGPSAGTWQLMGYCGGSNGGTTNHTAHRSSLYLRVS